MKPILLAAMLSLLAPAAARADLYQPYAAVLRTHVDEHGLVDYAGLKADRAGLDEFAGTIADLDPALYESWAEPERLAFWINAYNALTLRLIVDHYPIQSLAGREKYPARSIQQIPNPWSRPRYRVMGQERSLDDIEHNVIRKEFHEPRIHMALVCAAMSCPPLRREPFSGAELDAQLDDQSRRFFSDLRNLQIDREKNEVYASQILEWFADDFAPGVVKEHGQLVARRTAVVNAAGPHVPADARAYLEAGDFLLKYFDYDWTLNEQSK
ncbi:MAG: DUF547 domain-containing protein [Candidatus Krumholzibacteria bacterium]|nr:DUF547 domain-containing protein [Candidatus Krumholzibacteria bacterium]MDH4338064.1 DUF547 domain-containing protein [Candidatus Krumholzibacteria bacterium]MDH5270300.1 DUF547 domain-containing protein [Candidatus Krumholzibacteria bacterium]MDH5627553.1 DUF547 domain-containing protein [Candidatus Krumholzibacteria bacterium]